MFSHSTGLTSEMDGHTDSLWRIYTTLAWRSAIKPSQRYSNCTVGYEAGRNSCYLSVGQVQVGELVEYITKLRMVC